MLCSVSERLRTPLVDRYETWRKALERGAREARKVHRQSLPAATVGGRVNGSDVAGTISLEGRWLPFNYFLPSSPFFVLWPSSPFFRPLTPFVVFSRLDGSRYRSP